QLPGNNLPAISPIFDRDFLDLTHQYNTPSDYRWGIDMPHINPYWANVDSLYSYYDEEYEKVLSTSPEVEQHLPNLYTISFALDKERAAPKDLIYDVTYGGSLNLQILGPVFPRINNFWTSPLQPNSPIPDTTATQ